MTYPTVAWDEWRGSMDGRPVLWVKHLMRRWGVNIDIHKMVAPDDADCFHTHPAYAIRVILWGGYAEELHGGFWRMWRPGMIGLVKPSCCHRIAGFRNGRVSYSLWIRFRKTAKVSLRGDGWARQEPIYRAPDTIFEPEATMLIDELRAGDTRAMAPAAALIERLTAIGEIRESKDG